VPFSLYKIKKQIMALIPMLVKEMEQEAATTRKMLERIPNDKYDWKPHPKSMSVRQLASHIAELPSWVSMVLTTDELDFAANPYQPVPIRDTNDVLQLLEKSLKEGKKELARAKEEEMENIWTLRNGDQVYSRNSKADVIRMSYCQIVHHRAQMGVYLRLLDVPIPGSYGPSADDMNF
jgi:uncharacterized damage-inducible protein DinB